MENYVIVAKQDGMIKYYTDAPCCVLDGFFECARLFHNLGDAKRAWSAMGTFAGHGCRIAGVASAPSEEVPGDE